ncbi:UPF0481 protein [Senna tora]|uniref:UPF0481 protein n=1 Tax=Senna tora TaxID=362788 RepID=A0A835CI95_9FABA|nr:UPF0481 protein [Senna tora]
MESSIPNPERDAVNVSRLRCHLDKKSQSVWRMIKEGMNTEASIFNCPSFLTGLMYDRACMPNLVSIGPYHHNKDHLLEYETCKWYYLNKHISTARFDRQSTLNSYIETFKISFASRAKRCYQTTPMMSDHDFIEMMLLDGCFVVELLKLLGCPNCKDEIETVGDPILTEPWVIPILITDLLKLENQIPFFVLDMLWDEQKAKDSILVASLRVFNLLFQMPWHEDSRVRLTLKDYEPKNMLDLFHHCMHPSQQISQEHCLCMGKDESYHPWNRSIMCAKKLRASSIKFKLKKADSFLDINFRSRVLEIPSITINESTATILLNCVALEHARNDDNKFFSSYIIFMKSLINEPRDVAYLSSKGVITRFSKDDQFIARFFNDLGEVIGVNVRNSYLYDQIRKVETHYYSHWATLEREYFNSPWTIIFVLYALVMFLIGVSQQHLFRILPREEEVFSKKKKRSIKVDEQSEWDWNKMEPSTHEQASGYDQFQEFPAANHDESENEDEHSVRVRHRSKQHLYGILSAEEEGPTFFVAIDSASKASTRQTAAFNNYSFSEGIADGFDWCESLFIAFGDAISSASDSDSQVDVSLPFNC